MIIGIMGGTFDPVHLGHLAIAAAACQQLQMSEVVFIPAGLPYFKAGSRISTAEDRVKMLEIAIAQEPGFRISLMEIERPGPSYAVDTVTELKKSITSTDEIYYILGWDSLMALPSWKDPEKLISLCRLVAVPRPEYPSPDIILLEKELPGIAGRTVVMVKPLSNVSSTQIRGRVLQGLPIGHLVPPGVADYIYRQGLYRNFSDQAP